MSAGAERHRLRQPQWAALARCAQRFGPYKTLYNRWKRWGERGVFTRMMEGLAAGNAEPKIVMIDASYLKAHRTASSLRVKKGISAALSDAPKVA